MADEKGKMTPMDWLAFAQAAMPLLLAIIEMFKLLAPAKQEAIVNKVADAIAPTLPA